MAMKVTKTTFNMIAKNRADKRKEYVLAQRKRKDGTWGMPMKFQKFGKESDEEAVERLIKNNLVEYRLAQ